MSFKKQSPDQWLTFIKEHHPAYISYDEYEINQHILSDNAQAHGCDRRKSPPREGPALLQGLVICGICGKRMTVRYHTVQGRLVPDYLCQRRGIEYGESPCQIIKGQVIDQAVGDLLLESVTPLALEVALHVQYELGARFQQVDHLRKKLVERAQYEADLSRRRFMQVDPENRLVAATLEVEWNMRLKDLAKTEEDYEQKRKQDISVLEQYDREKIKSLASDFPKLWQNPVVPFKEKKRIVRLLIEDVTLIRKDGFDVHIRFKGGRTHSMSLPAPLLSWEQRKTGEDVVSQIDQLLNDYTDAEIADILNKQGKVSGTKKLFHKKIIRFIRREYKLKSRFARLREKKYLTLNEISFKLQVSPSTIKKWAARGLLIKHRYNENNEALYELDKNQFLEKINTRKQGKNRRWINLVSDRVNEVQYAI